MGLKVGRFALGWLDLYVAEISEGVDRQLCLHL